MCNSYDLTAGLVGWPSLRKKEPEPPAEDSGPIASPFHVVVGEMCSSKSSLSISAPWQAFGDEFGGLWHHALQRLKIDPSVL